MKLPQKTYWISIVAWLVFIGSIMVLAYEYVFLFFGAILIGNFVHAIALKLSEKIGFKKHLWSALLWIISFGAMVGVFVLFGVELNEKSEALMKNLKEGYSSVNQWIETQSFVSESTLNRINEQLTQVPQNFLDRIFGSLKTAMLMVFLVGLSIFTTFEMERLKHYIFLVVEKMTSHSKEATKKTKAMFSLMSDWMTDRLLSMLLVSVLIYLGLLFVDIEFKFFLAFSAGLLSFIPNLGPLLSLIPALLLSFSTGGDSALWVILIYGIVQTLESNLITPLIFKSNLSIPISMTFFFQFIGGALFGTMGVIFSVPVGLIFLKGFNMLEREK